MKKISQIKIRNFKAFQGEQVFDLKGKNVLAYGNNGSGQPVRGKKAEAVEMEIGALNTEIESLLSQI